jgi:hypothetical protein
MRDLEDFLTTTLAVRLRPKKTPTTATRRHGLTGGQPRAATTQSPEGPLAGGGLMEVGGGNSSMEGCCR